MKTFCTSDLHFGHGNIIDFENRPFKDTDHMNDQLVKRWNQRVNHDDVVFIVGDFYFNTGRKPFESAQFFNSLLNGNKIFILGNHDKNNKVKTKIKSLQINFAGVDINMVHRPIDYNPNYKLNIVGHCHSAFKVIKGDNNSILINCGVDVWNFRPVTMDKLIHEYRTAKKDMSKVKSIKEYYKYEESRKVK
jgi:calcineurin-like phosphoesterase family protein